MTKTCYGTASTAASAATEATEEEEYNGCDGVDTRHRLDDKILLRLIVAMALGSTANVNAQKKYCTVFFTQQLANRQIPLTNTTHFKYTVYSMLYHRLGFKNWLIFPDVTV